VEEENGCGATKGDKWCSPMSRFATLSLLRNYRAKKKIMILASSCCSQFRRKYFEDIYFGKCHKVTHAPSRQRLRSNQRPIFLLLISCLWHDNTHSNLSALCDFSHLELTVLQCRRFQRSSSRREASWRCDLRATVAHYSPTTRFQNLSRSDTYQTVTFLIQ